MKKEHKTINMSKYHFFDVILFSIFAYQAVGTYDNKSSKK
jgi:hypothetical protein